MSDVDRARTDLYGAAVRVCSCAYLNAQALAAIDGREAAGPHRGPAVEMFVGEIAYVALDTAAARQVARDLLDAAELAERIAAGEWS